MDFFIKEQFDILGLQEIKMQREQGDYDFINYEEYWYSAEKKGYAGTAIFAKEAPLNVCYGLGIDAHDQEGRMITAEYDEFYFVTVYAPNAKRELTRLDYRMQWEDDFRAYVEKLAKKKGVIICGDLNVAHTEIDLANPKPNEKNSGFTKEERGQFSKLLAAGFIDTYRYVHPEKTGAYTWWSYMNSARTRNIGWRIDYFLVSENLKSAIKAVDIYADILGSDHCPIGLTLSFDR